MLHRKGKGKWRVEIELQVKNEKGNKEWGSRYGLQAYSREGERETSFVVWIACIFHKKGDRSARLEAHSAALERPARFSLRHA